MSTVIAVKHRGVTFPVSHKPGALAFSSKPIMEGASNAEVMFFLHYSFSPLISGALLCL